MGNTKVAIVQSCEEAEKHISELRAAGFRDDQIGFLAKDLSARTDHAAEYAGDGAVIGATAGAVTSAAVGIGIMAGVIPVIGPILATGPLAVTLLNAASGAAVAGIAGALTGLGVHEIEATQYETLVLDGQYLVCVADTDLAKPTATPVPKEASLTQDGNLIGMT